MAHHNCVYDQLIEVADDYLGPSSRQAIDRQIINHLNKKPIDITYSDLSVLIDWIKVMAAFLTDDKKATASFTHRLQTLAATTPA